MPPSPGSSSCRAAATAVPVARATVRAIAVPAVASVLSGGNDSRRPRRIGSSIQRQLAVATTIASPARASRSTSGSSSPIARPAAGRTSSGQWTRYSENEIRPRNRSGARSRTSPAARDQQPGEDDGRRTDGRQERPGARIRRRRVDDEERGDDHAEAEPTSRREQPARESTHRDGPHRAGRGDREQATEAELPGARGQREERPRLRDVGEDDRLRREAAIMTIRVMPAPRRGRGPR